VNFLVSRWGRGTGAIENPSASYFQDAGFHPMVYIGQGGLATKDVTVVKL
jgi:hypothetical protein